MTNRPSATQLRVLLDYNEETGQLRWRQRGGITREDKIFNTKFAGKIAGSLNEDGYVEVNTRRVGHFLAHQLIWLMKTDEWPTQIDHINHIGHDNRWNNLRLATKIENAQNIECGWGRSKFKGVYFHERANKWMGYITVNRCRLYLGLFVREENAALAYNFAAHEHFGEFVSYN